MITFPKYVQQEVLRIGRNRIVRVCGSDRYTYQENIEIIATSPFVIRSGDRTILLTRNENDRDNSEYEYIAFVNKTPNRAKFNRGEVVFVRWIRHPLFSKKSPDEIVKSWKGKFLYTKEDLEHNEPGLRAPQLGAIYAFMSKAQMQQHKNIIVMPTGTGKTETMLSILIANQCKKLLVTVPSDALREQLSEKFITLGILQQFGIVAANCECPYVAVIKEGMGISKWNEIINRSNVVVTTMPLISQVLDDVKFSIFNDFTHLFVDEAHHSEADTWSTFINAFPDNKITLFTATPFRNDGKKLRGEFIYSFSLKDAQEQGYYKPIKFIPIREYDNDKADKKIAETAVAQLKEDISKGYNHILMARCATKKRAEEIFKYYQKYKEFNPIIVYSSIANKSYIIKDIKEKKHKIIVCVNMLGEGFDLPEMKIAALHDARQSIAVTLQFIGRFTRTSYDTQLGYASFIANIAYPLIHDELQDLYAKDANWNNLLPLLNDGITKEEIDLNDYLRSFQNINESNVPFRNIEPALSATIYRVGSIWNPQAWKEVFTEDNFNYRFSSVNTEGDTLVIILGSIDRIIWETIDCIQNLIWNVVIVHRYCTPEYNHAYINSSVGIDTDKLVTALFGENNCNQRVSGITLFRVFSGVKRFAVVNFGGRKGRPGNVSFKSYYGKDVQEGITLTEQGQLSKNNIFGNGYRNGERISIGCSIKGKVWSYMRGNLLEFNKWSRMIGQLVEDSTIDPNIVLQNTLKIKSINSLPQIQPISIDWDAELYRDYQEQSIYVRLNKIDYHLWDIDLQLVQKKISQNIEFEIIINSIFISHYSIQYGMSNNGLPFYKVTQLSGELIGFSYGSKLFNDICEYFNENNAAPVIFFADGSQLFATNLVRVNEAVKPINPNALIGLDWSGVNLNNESQHVIPYEKDSIQYFFSQKIKNDFDVLYDDDGSGEIADLIGLKDEDKAIHIHLFHLKYAHEGKISNLISNFYEVCGQAQKSLKWNDREKSRVLFTRLFAREQKKYGDRKCSRILKGSKEDLERMSTQINWKKDLVMHISIVQPSLSLNNPSKDILNLLGAVSSYIKDVSNIDLKIYCSK
jgi:superfamily II DNA or RNA helicase